MDFDTPVERRGTHSAKWDMMERVYGVSPEDGIPMWVADMDFRPPQAVQEALAEMQEVGIYGYFGGDAAYRAAIGWWMETRHGWSLDPEWIATTHGLVNGVGVALDAFTEAGDAVVLFTPVYHAFARTIIAADRTVTELPMVQQDGRYVMEFDESRLTGRERMLILCSPHNPGGRVWTRDELEEVAEFARRHDLILVSDEIHHDLLMPGQRHVPMALIEGVEDRLVMLTSTSKTFNIAGAHTGNVIIPDDALRARFAKRLSALGLSPNSFGLHMATAAYSPGGAEWLDALIPYLDGNRKILDAAIAAIPGARSMPLESTYLGWADFTGTGMEEAEVMRRIEQDARIAVNHGSTFGTGGAGFARFNFATPRARVEAAAERLKEAFGDLQ
ncbi:MalY/PatB family protein [Pseudoroseicyclus aestuarii]|uniref:cysteine-S-conjugate beta-lyase n=1 Tax=Pseudoroseicyclus aestuarii TaxID=1795041 RepID=A0A318SWQ3_9RHOB|nr:MalY/PatB family protein [Pseudoroseicyclus aestuarii]PYE84247.1 cystathionine beta-lyase [Pseudoroseicyclus aestuarii]